MNILIIIIIISFIVWSFLEIVKIKKEIKDKIYFFANILTIISIGFAVYAYYDSIDRENTLKEQEKIIILDNLYNEIDTNNIFIASFINRSQDLKNNGEMPISKLRNYYLQKSLEYIEDKDTRTEIYYCMISIDIENDALDSFKPIFLPSTTEQISSYMKLKRETIEQCEKNLPIIQECLSQINKSLNKLNLTKLN
jgi:hypothetical protein